MPAAPRRLAGQAERDCWLCSTGPGNSCPAAAGSRLPLQTARRPAAPGAPGRERSWVTAWLERQGPTCGRQEERAAPWVPIRGWKGQPELGRTLRVEGQREGRPARGSALSAAAGGARQRPQPRTRRRSADRARGPAAGLTAPCVHSVNSCVCVPELLAGLCPPHRDPFPRV